MSSVLEPQTPKSPELSVRENVSQIAPVLSQTAAPTNKSSSPRSKTPSGTESRLLEQLAAADSAPPTTIGAFLKTNSPDLLEFLQPLKKDDGAEKSDEQKLVEELSKRESPRDKLQSPMGKGLSEAIMSEKFADLEKLEKLMEKIDVGYELDEVTTGTESSSSGEEEEEYTPPAVGKLRALARVVMINLRWAKDIRKAHEYLGFEAGCLDHHTGLQKRVFFNLADFLASKRVISGLTEPERIALRLHPIARKPEDIETVSKVLDRYKCFEKFTPEVRKQLAVWGRYDTFDDARVLLRQGHEPYSMYFILTGSVSFKASDTDRRTGRTNFYPLGVRGPNTTIGEIELLNVDERRSTGVTQGDVELLRIDEDPFNDILRSSFEALWDDRFSGLRSAQTFESWSDAELKILNENSSLINFEVNKPILTDVFGPSAFSYFIQKGRCAMVKDVVFERMFYGKDFRNPLYRALDVDDERRWISPSKLKAHHELEGHHLHITEFTEGDYFGVGENLRRTHIIALTTVECLTIPRSVFEKANRLQFLEDLKADLEDAIPSDEQILDEWLALQSWKDFKKSHLKKFWTKMELEEHAKFFTLHRKHRLDTLYDSK